MYAILQSRLEGLKADAAEFARELVGVESMSLHEEHVAELVEQKMRALGFHKVVRDDYGNVVGALLGRQATSTLALVTHLDTVAAAKDDAHPCRVKDGRLYGLGAADCKGGIAAQLYAAYLLKYSLLPLDGNLVVAATVAEENGLGLGVRGLMERTLPEMGLKPDNVILGEPTGLGLYYGHDGWMEMDIEVEGMNPFQVDDIARNIATDLGDAMGNPEAGGENFALSHNTRRQQGGVATASMRVSRRLRQHGDEVGMLTQVTHDARQSARNSGAVEVAVQVRQDAQRLYTGRTWNTDPFDPLMTRARQALAAAGCASQPGKWQLGRLGMGTAGSALVNEFKIPTIGYGPGCEEQAHACGEFVELEKIYTAIYGTAAIAHSLIGIPVCGWTADEI
ncbi:MAG: M20/M25/M40 family metallo-hydrolase [Kiritimatiellaeota bacterium]|nr:M20/M25/M40 family metallo-hydrolase [Kiritimatiellota bacterium]